MGTRETLKGRLQSLEDIYSPSAQLPGLILRIEDCRHGAPPVSDAQIIGTSCLGREFDRLPGETVEAMCARVDALVRKPDSQAVPVHILRADLPEPAGYLDDDRPVWA